MCNIFPLMSHHCHGICDLPPVVQLSSPFTTTCPLDTVFLTCAWICQVLQHTCQQLHVVMSRFGFQTDHFENTVTWVMDPLLAIWWVWGEAWGGVLSPFSPFSGRGLGKMPAHSFGFRTCVRRTERWIVRKSFGPVTINRMINKVKKIKKACALASGTSQVHTVHHS